MRCDTTLRQWLIYSYVACFESNQGAGLVVQQLSAQVLLLWPRVHWFGSRVRTWHRMASHAVVGVPHIKWRKMGMDVSSGPVFLRKEEEDLQMLA